MIRDTIYIIVRHWEKKILKRSYERELMYGLQLRSRHWRNKQSSKTQAEEASTRIKVLWASEKIHCLHSAAPGCVQAQPPCLQDRWLSERRGHT